MEGELATRVRDGGTGSKPVMQMLEESLSTSVQITESRGALAESVPVEMELLMRLYVEPMREKVVRRRSGRAGIAAQMRSTLERAGVWDLNAQAHPGQPVHEAGRSAEAGLRLSPEWGDPDLPGGVAGGRPGGGEGACLLCRSPA